MAFDPQALDPAGFNWGATQESAPPPEALPTAPDMSSDEWDNPSAEPVEDIEAQLQDLAADSERMGVYLSPDQGEMSKRKHPPGSVVIEDFDGKGGQLITRNQEVADKALEDQTAGVSLQKIIGGLTLAGSGKPDDPSALVVQKLTPDGAVQRESVQATPEEAQAVADKWGEGVSFTDMPTAIQRREKLIRDAAGGENLNAMLVAQVMKAETGGRTGLTSQAGAEGLMQIMPGTQKDLGITDVWNEEQSVYGGAKYIRQMMDKFGNDREKALAAYNWGPGNMERHLASLAPGEDWKEGLPDETKNYVKITSIGGTSEQLAQEYEGGLRSATRESLDEVGRQMQAKNISNLEGGVYDGLDFQERGDTAGGAGAGADWRTSLQDMDPDGPEWRGMNQPEPSGDDYGWGIKYAFMRGLLRAGQLIDLAQGDADEYAEGAESLENWEVSEGDAERLAELQESESFWDALGYYVTNPALAMQVVVESLPMSAAPLAGGLAGSVAGSAAAGPVGTIIGGMTGAGLGSFATEYLASIGDALSEAGVDATSAQELKDAFANEELMARARELGTDRGIGVAAWDALSMGIAGRIFKPIKALTGAATKTGAVLGGTSEIVAQASAGALGELSAQKIAGQEYDPAAVAGEFIGEIVPGVGEIAINKATGKDVGGNKPDDTTPPPKKPKVKRNPDGSWSEVDDLGDPADASSEGDVPADVEESIPPTADDVDIDAEAEDQVVTPPPETETATTSKTTAPSSQEEASSEVVGETSVEEMLETAANEEEAADVAAAEADSPLIDTKTLGPKVTKTIKDQKVQTPVRTAWRGVMNALSERYSDSTATVPSGTFSGTGVAKFFKQLQEDVDITTELPELKAFLEEVTTGKPAEVIQALERLTGQVRSSNPTLTDAPIDSVAGQVQAVYNNFMEYFEGAQRLGKGKTNKNKPLIKGNKLKMANKLGELAGAVRNLLTAAEDAGVLEEAGIGANYGKTMELADQIADAAQSPTEKKTASGGKTKGIQFGDTTLLTVANNLKAIAEKVTPLLAKAEAKAQPAVDKQATTETSTKGEKLKAKAKATVQKPVTAQPAKPKAAAKAKKTSTAKAEAKGPSYAELRARAKALGVNANGNKVDLAARIQEVEADPAAAEKHLTKAGKEAARVKAEIAKGEADLKAAVKPEVKVTTKKSKGKPTMGMSSMLKTKAERDAEAKPDIPDAAPADVFDKEQNITGHEAKQIKEDMGVDSVDEAFEKAGVSKSAATKIRGIMGTLDKEGKQQLTEAASDFAETGDMARFTAQIHKLVGKVPSPALVEAYTEFVLALSEQEAARPATSEDALDNIQDDHLDMTEDEREIAEMTGAIEPRFDDDTTVDEHNVPWIDRLKKIMSPNENLSPAERTRFNLDQRMLERALNKIRIELGQVTHSLDIDKQGIPVGKIDMQEMIDLLLSALPPNHRYTNLLKMLKDTNLKINVELHDSVFGVSPYGDEGGRFSFGKTEEGTVDPAGSTIKVVYDQHNRGDAGFVRTLIHEMLHAATAVRYHTDKAFARHIDVLWLQAIEKFAENDVLFSVETFSKLVTEGGTEAATDYINTYLLAAAEGTHSKMYGLANPHEFMAEAFTNSYFQEFLNSIDAIEHANMMPKVRRRLKASSLSNRVRSLFDAFVQSIGDFLGISVRNSVLREVLEVTAANLDNNISHAFAKGRFRVGKSLPSKKAPPRSAAVDNTADAARARDSKVKQTFDNLVDTLRTLPRAINLGFMNRDVIERNYRELFDRASKAAGHLVSPLTVYIKAKQNASRIAEEYAKRATKALEKLQKLSNETRAKVFDLMRDTTLAQVWPQVSLRHKMNDHLWSKPDKDGVRQLSPTLGEAAKKARKQWVALNRKDPVAATLLVEMAGLTKEIQARKRLEALRTVGKTYELDATIVKRLGMLESHDDIMKMFPGVYDKDGNVLPNKKKARPADTLPEKGDTKEIKEAKQKKLQKWRENRAIANTAEQIVKGTSINGPYFPLRRYGKYVVSSTDAHNEDNAQFVSFHNTRQEARRVAAAIQEKHGIPTYVTKKIESVAIARDVTSVAADLASRLDGDKTSFMHKQLNAAMIEIMADNAAYASQLKRHGIDGVASDDMGRAFEEYVFVSKYTLGDISTAYEVTKSLKDMNSLKSSGSQDPLNQGAATVEEIELIGDVVTELGNQNKEDAKDREMSSFQKGVGLIGFFNFLGAPSYWVLNATQTLTVTLPYLGAKWGLKGNAAYTQAAKTVLSAAKGAKSYEQFKANLPPAAQKVVTRLEEEGILQSTIAHQFGDIMSTSTMTAIRDWAGPVGKATATALKLMETIPEGVEKYNRISTALAIYNLSDGNMTAVADGVQATQFNYDSANRARLLKAAPSWAGGGLRAVITPMMMFKSYGIGLTRLLYGSMADVVLKKGGRAEAAKLAGGLIVSHSVFGGMAGGLMIAPVQAIVWAFNKAFREAGDEFDPEEAVELYLQDVANDTVAALVARGVPAAAGLEMSKSINLGNLIWMGNDRINLGDAGGVETMMTTALGPVAQYAITTAREGARIWNEDPRANWYDFVAAAIPLKMARGTIRGLKYEMEGVGTDTLTFIEPDDVDGWLRSAMGFRPTGIAMTTDFEYGEMGRDARRGGRKSALIDKALRADTAKERADAWEDIERFNRSLESRGDYIRRGDMVRLKSRRRSRQRDHDRERR